MPSRILVAQNTEDSQVLRTDNRRKFIVTSGPDWQFLFNPNSEISTSIQTLKIAAELDPDTLDSIRFTAYLYNPVTGSIDNAATCEFKIYKVVKSGWQDQLITTISGTIQANHYFYAEKVLEDLSPADLDGGHTLMVDVTVTRLSETFRDRVYINHLGIYDSFIRLSKKVDFLELTKVDE